MKGILIKDFYNIKKQIVWYIGMMCVFFAVSVIVKNIAFIASIGLLVTISVPLTAIAYEEKESWQKFIVASGISKKIIVFEKYLLGFVFFALSSAGYVAVYFLLGEKSKSIIDAILPVCMQLLILAAVLPAVFKLGVEKARAFTIIIIAAVMLALVGILSFSASIGKDAEIIVAVMISVVSAVLVVSSYLISLKIYNNKEFL